MQWVKFLKAFDQQKDEKNDVEAKSYKEGDMIGIDEKTAKSLKQYGFVEFIEKPDDNDDDLDDELQKTLKSFATGIEKAVSDSMNKVFEQVGDVLHKKIDLTPDQKKKELLNRGYEDEGQFLQSLMKAHNPSKYAFNVGGEDGNLGVELLNKAPTGQNVSNDPEGGFAVPDVMANAIWDNITQDPASILPLTDRFETSGNSMKVPRLFESSRKSGTGKRHGGVVTTWLDEADEIQVTKTTIGRLNMQVHKLGAVIYLTSEMMADAPASFARRIKRLVPQAINFEVEEAFFHGTGVGKPKGILQGDSLIIIPLEAGQGNHTILHRNINKMYWRHWNRSNAVWYMHPDLAQILEFIAFDDATGANKRPIFQPPGGLADSPLGRLYGRPAVVTEHMKDLGSVGDIAFFDWSQYATLTKIGGGISTASSIHVRFLFEEEAFRFTFRIDGQELWTSPKEDLYGDTTRSPFLTLGSRTGGGTSSGL